ncbi:NADPH dehydrogenase [Colletotrichum tabaci]|uniref:NADPH dehydrogenase n=1 Tax=Colletotrichum tabaci TaxID=1209068 RepID=A0AAV9T3K5_9PEZI
MSASKSRLFEPVKVGTIELKHRIAMAPLTRFRNDEDHLPSSFMLRYYADRASVPGTLITSEATAIAVAQEGHKYLPSFATDAQAAGWEKIIQAVHNKGSFWFQQLWDLGRGADPAYAAERGSKYRSSSAVALAGVDGVPEEMSEEEIQQVIQSYVATAKRVIAAGGDGVEIHSAQGYLLDQFLSDKVNQRTDKWGGSIENRARLTLEVVRAVAAAIGIQRVALRLSPYATYQDSLKSDTKELNLYIIEELKKLDGPLAYISLVEAVGDPVVLFYDSKPDAENKTLDFILEAWDNRSPVIVAGGYTPESAQLALDTHYKKWDVVIAFGRHFIANPDLVYRIKNGVELTKYNRDTFYVVNSEEGYNDYPFSPEFLKASA